MENMENIEKISNLVMNHGMSVLITCYFLFRDWKYQGQLINLMGNISSTLVGLKEIVEILRGYHINDQ